MTTTLDRISHLTSSAQVSAQPTPPSGDIATAPVATDSIRTLAQKIEQFNTDENTNLLVSMLDGEIKFSMVFFKDEFIERRKAFDSGNKKAKVNFSASLFTPTIETRLYRYGFSRRHSPVYFHDWDTFELPKTITQDQRNQLDALTNHFNQAYAALDALYECLGVDEEVLRQAIHNERAAKIELAQLRLALWEGHPEVINFCPHFEMGYLVSDRALIQNAFPQALNTRNLRYAVSLNDGPDSKLVAIREGSSELKRDKHVKRARNRIVDRGRDATLAALRKHVEKRKQTDQLTEVLIGAPDDDLTHVVDGFFLEMRSGFEKMNLATVNLYLRHSSKAVQERMEQIRGFPLLVSYSDLDSGRNKFAFVTLNPEGVPVAMETRPNDKNPDHH